MGNLDLSGALGKKFGAHYKICVGGKTVSYCYIRKNACSAFKVMFTELSDVKVEPGESELKFMNRAHLAGIEDVISSDYRVCILRDPVERMVSLYQNKFLNKNGNSDIFKSYVNVTGLDPDAASFYDFVSLYLANAGDRLDPHARSQLSHLMPIQYNSALMMPNIMDGMGSVIGFDRSVRFFKNKKNSTSGITNVDRDLSKTPASKIISMKVMPGLQDLCCAEAKETIVSLYSGDYRAIEQYIP